MHQHHADAFGREPRIERERLADEVVEAGDRLDAGEATAGDDEGEQAVASGGAFGVAFLERRDDAIAQVNCVAQRLHRQRALLEAWQAVEVGDRAERDHQLVVRQAVVVALEAVRHGDAAAIEINPVDVADEDLGPLQQRPQRADDVRDVEVAGGDLVQHRREQEEVVARDERDFDARVAGEHLFEVARSVHAAESTAEHHDPLRRHRHDLAGWMSGRRGGFAS